jgi:hypothetical protein
MPDGKVFVDVELVYSRCLTYDEMEALRVEKRAQIFEWQTCWRPTMDPEASCVLATIRAIKKRCNKDRDCRAAYLRFRERWWRRDVPLNVERS